ncbi:hypothetical protein GH146_02555 [archaeon]|nr:hypothetical protein [archaeon]
MKRSEREGLERVAMYLDLARSYSCGEDRDKAILRAIECLGVVLKADNRLRKRVSDALKVTFGA